MGSGWKVPQAVWGIYAVKCAFRGRVGIRDQLWALWLQWWQTLSCLFWGTNWKKKIFFSRIALTSRNLYYLTDNKWSCELLFHIVMWCIVEANFCWKFLNEEQRSFTLWGVSSVGSQFFSFILDLDWLSFLRMFTSLFHYSITDNNKYLDPEKYRLNTESSPTVGKKWRTLWNERWSVSLLDFSTDMQALKITRK